MRARVTLRGLVPIVGKGDAAREAGVIEWDRWDGATGRYVLRDEAGRVARIEGQRAIVELASASAREQRVAGRLRKRAFERAWRDGTIEHVGRTGPDVWAMRFMAAMVAVPFGLAVWMFGPRMLAMLWAGVSTWIDAAVIAISLVVLGGMMMPVAIFAVLLWDVRDGWVGRIAREIRMTREGVTLIDGKGRERTYAWEVCERVRVGFGGVAWFQGGGEERERVVLLGLGWKGRRILGLVQEEIEAREARGGRRSARRSMMVPLLIGLCVLHGVMLSGAGMMAGVGQGAVPWGRVAMAFVVGTAAPAMLVGALFYGTRVMMWWERSRRLARRRRG